MKTLYFLEMEYQAEKIVKNEDSIIGYIGDAEVFSFRGVSDFSAFKLAEGEEFDLPAPSEEAKLKEELTLTKKSLADLEFTLMMNGVI